MWAFCHNNNRSQWRQWIAEIERPNIFLGRHSVEGRHRCWCVFIIRCHMDIYTFITVYSFPQYLKQITLTRSELVRDDGIISIFIFFFFLFLFFLPSYHFVIFLLNKRYNYKAHGRHEKRVMTDVYVLFFYFFLLSYFHSSPPPPLLYRCNQRISSMSF